MANLKSILNSLGPQPMASQLTELGVAVPHHVIPSIHPDTNFRNAGDPSDYFIAMPRPSPLAVSIAILTVPKFPSKMNPNRTKKTSFVYLRLQLDFDIILYICHDLFLEHPNLRALETIRTWWLLYVVACSASFHL